MPRKCCISIGILVVVLTCLAFAQAPPVLWTQHYDEESLGWWNRTFSVEQTSDGGFILVGDTWEYVNYKTDIWMVRTDANGDSLWAKKFGNPDSFDNTWNSGAVKETPDKGFIICGYTRGYGAGDYDVYLIRTDSLGDTLWTKTMGSQRREQGFGVVVTPDSGYAIIASSEAGGGTMRPWLIKADPDGNIEWDNILTTQYAVCYCIEQTDDRGYIAAGSKSVGGTYLVKTDSLGEVEWEQTYGGGTAKGVQQTAGGGYVLAAQKFIASGNVDIFIVYTDANGDSIWTKLVGGSRYDESYDVVALYDGGFTIAGYTQQTFDDYDAYVLCFTSDGDTNWTIEVGGAYEDKAHTIDMTSDYGYVVAGWTESDAIGGGDLDFWLIRLGQDNFATPPPRAPYIYARKYVDGNKESVQLFWPRVIEDIMGNPITIDHYDIYANSDPAYIPGPADLIGTETDTFFITKGLPAYGTKQHYLVFAELGIGKVSEKSNMGYGLWKSFEENPITTDKVWVSAPWHYEYPLVSDFTTANSPDGNPLIQITNLRDDQYFESWTWDDVFNAWTGSDFALASGNGFEMVTLLDTMLILIGSNNPDGSIALNENPLLTDKNWVSLPYNVVYDSVFDITDEFSSSGDPLIQITNLRDDQYYESWTWDDVFLQWAGDSFAIEAGRAYEFVTVIDTFWNPTEYPNKASCFFAKNEKGKRAQATVYCGKVAEKKEARAPGVSHIVRCYFEEARLTDVRFVMYRPEYPDDILSETQVGCYTITNGECTGIGCNVGNFGTPWKADEDVVLEISGTKRGIPYEAKISFVLDDVVDIQDLGVVSLRAAGDEGVTGSIVTGIPREFSLRCRSNPVVGNAEFWCGLPGRDHVRLSVYDGSGRCIRNLVDGELDAGYHSVKFNTRSLSAGMYFVRMDARGFCRTEKIIVLR